MGRNVHALEAGGTQQLLIDAFLLGHLQVIGDAHHDHAVVQRFGLFIGQKFVEFCLVRMGNNTFVGIDQRKAAGLDVLFLGQCQQHVEKAFVGLEHFDELHQATIRHVELAVKAVGTGIRL